MPPSIYLDNAASTAPHPEVISTMLDCMQNNYANPSSLHKMGQSAEKMLRQSRQLLAGSLNCEPEELIFCSGGTEANNLAVMGSLLPFKATARQNKILCSGIEHPSVLNQYRYLELLGYKVIYLPVNTQGILEARTLEKHMDETVRLVSIMWVNNELGTIQNIPFLGNIVKQYDAVFHVDAVQAWGKIPLSIPSPVDLLSLSGHKIHGPKGIGVLYKKKATRLRTIYMGGAQEQGLRPGTENTYAIAGLARAVELLPDRGEWDRISTLRHRLTRGLEEQISGLHIRTAEAPHQVPHILSLSIPGIRAEILIHSLESRDIHISTGAACNSRQKKPNHVLQAIGLNEREMDSSIRISLGHYNTETDIDTAVSAITEEVEKLRKILNLK